MVCNLFDEWSEDIKQFCLKNNYNFEKAKKMSKCWGNNMLALQYYKYDPLKAKEGLRDETPLPLVLMIKKESGKLIFEQTEFTSQYLS